MTAVNAGSAARASRTAYSGFRNSNENVINLIRQRKPEEEGKK
jgi:hypothetical protein